MTIGKITKNRAIIALASLALVSSFSLLSAQAEQTKPPLSGMLRPGTPVSFADLIEQVSPAVVSINVITREEPAVPGVGNLDNIPEEFREWLQRQMPGQNRRSQPAPREGRSLGSGFLISGDGHVVTNHHVIDKAYEITVGFEDGKEFDAVLIGSDERTDLAVLKIESDQEFTHVNFAKDVKLRVGDWIVAVGNPFGLGGTATAGIVSATGREIGRSAYDFLQVDASINRGNSGGPTFDLYGNVVGVNSQILSPTGGNIGIGFAIPARLASKITQELIAKGSVTRGWLGVQVQRVTQDIADSEGLSDSKGALVADVVDDSPAKKAGFKDGDIILKLDGVVIEDQRDLTRRVGEMFVGHSAKFSILRDGRKKNLNVKIGKRDDAAEAETPDTDQERDEADEFGLRLGSLNDEGRERLGIEDDRGVLIVSVDPGSQAARKGFRKGDAIVAAGDLDLFSADDFEKAVATARKKNLKAVRLLVRTQGGQTYTALRLDK